MSFEPFQLGLPADLKRIVTIIEPNINVSHCEKVDEEVIETLDYQSGELIVNRTVIPQYWTIQKRRKPIRVISGFIKQEKRH